MEEREPFAALCLLIEVLVTSITSKKSYFWAWPQSPTPQTPPFTHTGHLFSEKKPMMIIMVVVVVVIFYYSDMGEDCYIVTYYKKVSARLPRP